MKIHMLVGRLLLGSLALTGVAAAQVEATHSTGAGTVARDTHAIVWMRHVGARTTSTAVTAPSAAEAATGKESSTSRVPRLPAVHFRL
jgi:hypothetical protein